MQKPWLSLLAYTFIALGLMMLIVCFIAFTNTSYYDFKFGGKTNANDWGAFGSAISGTVGTLFSIAGIILVIQTLQLQQKDSRKSEIENRFLKLIELHKENVNEVESGEIKGRQAFVSIKEDFDYIYDCVLKCELFKELEDKGVTIPKDVKMMYQLNLAYVFFFYGFGYGENFLAVFQRVGLFFKRAYEQHKILPEGTTLEEYLLEKIEKTIKSEAVYIDIINYWESFIGYQHQLSYYHRHLYQAVNYINNQSILSYTEKYEYIKMLRAQLSTHEQAILFYNSVSVLGYQWEIKHREKSLERNPKKNASANNYLITKYNLIKNMPGGFCAPIRFITFYPDVEYEFCTTQKLDELKRTRSDYKFT